MLENWMSYKLAYIYLINFVLFVAHSYTIGQRVYILSVHLLPNISSTLCVCLFSTSY